MGRRWVARQSRTPLPEQRLAALEVGPPFAQGCVEAGAAAQMLGSIKTEERSDTSKENLSRQAEGAKLDTFEQAFWDKMEMLDTANKEFRLATNLQAQVNAQVTPIHNQVLRLTRLVDQIILNVDKHEN